MFSLPDLVQLSTFTFEEIEEVKWLPVSTELAFGRARSRRTLKFFQQDKLIWTFESISSTGPELKASGTNVIYMSAPYFWKRLIT